MTDTPMLEIVIKGPGDLTIGLVDAKGRMLMKKRFVVSGDPTLEATSRLPLSLRTRDGKASEVVPAVIRQLNKEQRVTFDGQDAAAFTRLRCKQVKVAPSVIERAAKGAAAQTGPGGSILTVMSVPSGKR